MIDFDKPIELASYEKTKETFVLYGSVADELNRRLANPNALSNADLSALAQAVHAITKVMSFWSQKLICFKEYELEAGQSRAADTSGTLQ